MQAINIGECNFKRTTKVYKRQGMIIWLLQLNIMCIYQYSHCDENKYFTVGKVKRLALIKFTELICFKQTHAFEDQIEKPCYLFLLRISNWTLSRKGTERIHASNGSISSSVLAVHLQYARDAPMSGRFKFEDYILYSIYSIIHQSSSFTQA